jgi:eukaryotic-like serine/threonine-protein kinase
MIGRTLGHYRIVAPLGVGAMGEVYRAHDEKLDRDVALKVLPAGLIADDEARSRFRKEARALSRLSHPHVAMLLDFDSADGVDFLAMELVPGRTLAEELAHGGPLPAKDAVRLGAQLARGLKAAHDQGVVHRDLKPSNLALTGDGLLKVLDFGVARLVTRDADAGAGDTTTTTHSDRGGVVGSPPYMSPEQVLGKEVDARTDLYSAGALLYEIVTGRRPFGALRGGELKDAILHRVPERPGAIRSAVPPGLESVILKALEKDPALRHQTAGDLLADFERLARDGTAIEAVTAPPAPAGAQAVARPPLGWRGAAAGLALLATAGGVWFARPSSPPRILSIRPITERLPPNPDPNWATDGSRLYYSHGRGSRRYWQVPLAGGEPTEIPSIPHLYGLILGYVHHQSSLLMGGSTVSGTPTTAPLWPEGDDPPLVLVTVPTWTARRVGSLRSALAALSSDERELALVYGPGRRHLGLARIDGSGFRPLLELASMPLSLAWARDGRRLRFTAAGPADHAAEPWTWETSVAGEPPRPLWPGSWGQWSGSGGDFLLERGEVEWTTSRSRYDLFAVREEPWRPWRRPEPVRITSGPMSFRAPGSPDGRTVYALGELPRGELVRLAPGSAMPVPFAGGVSAHYAEASPDGGWVAWVSHPDAALWRSRPDGSEQSRLTAAGTATFLPRWSPDGRSLVFLAQAQGESTTSVARVSADGGLPEVLAAPPPGQDGYWDACFLPDGERVVFSRLTHGLFEVDASAPGRVSPIAGADALVYPKCARQGHILASGPRRSGTWGSFVRWAGTTDWKEIDLPNLAYPNWTRDGKAIVGLVAASQQVVRVTLATGRRETLADLGATPLVVWVTVPWIGLAADDTPLVTLDRGTRGFYALDWEER